jgi:hypothetical protein
VGSFDRIPMRAGFEVPVANNRTGSVVLVSLLCWSVVRNDVREAIEIAFNIFTYTNVIRVCHLYFG